MKFIKIKRLASRGHIHLFLPLLVIVLVAVVGTYVLVASHADPKAHVSSYYLYSNGGQYPYVQISASAGFSTARCGKHLITNGKWLAVPTPGASTQFGPLTANCITPAKSGDAYLVAFDTAQPTGPPTAQQQVSIPQGVDSCVFVHAPDAPNPQGLITYIAPGITHILGRNVDGSCNKSVPLTLTPATTPAPAKPTPTPAPVTKSPPAPAKPKPAPVVSTANGLISPPNFSSAKKDKLGYYLLPASPGNKNYYIHTNSMPGGESSGSSPAGHRYGEKMMIDVFYTVAVEYHAKYSNSKLVAGDVNAPGHTTHRNGIDMDIYSSDRSAAMVSSKGGSDARSIALAKMLLNTGKIKFILFNDPNVQKTVNAYAKSKGLPARMLESNETHDFHFHVRVNDHPGPCVYGTASACAYARTIFDNKL